MDVEIEREDERIRAALARVALPGPRIVDRWEVRRDIDATGDEAVWVYVVVREDAIDGLWPYWNDLRRGIRKAVGAVAGDHVVTYVRMWSTADDAGRGAAA